MTARKPRKVQPGTVLVGDKIRVTDKNGDVSIVKEARVGSVIYNGTTRIIRSMEGVTLYVWELGSPLNPIVHLIEAAPFPQEPLPGMDEIHV